MTAPADRSTTYWCELAWLPPGEVRSKVLVRVTGGRIATVEPETSQPPPDTRTLTGLTLPGFADAHSHAFHRALRGRTNGSVVPAGAAGTFWTWREQMYALAGRLTPESYALLARAVFAEMALAGITCVGEFHYLHHAAGGRAYDDPNAIAHVLVEAARSTGLRIALLDACYLTGGIGQPLTGVQRRFGDGDADRWSERVGLLHAAYAQADDVVVGAAVHSVRALPPAAMETVAGWAADRQAPLHVHLSEQERENSECRAAYGVSPTRLLGDHGVLGPRTTAVHATHLDDSDIDHLARTGTAVCLCPTTERDLADGIGPAHALAAAGCPLVLGSDSHAVVDMFAEAQAMEMDERLATRRRGHWSTAHLLDAMSPAGHRALGFVDAGVVAPGARADLVSVRLDSVRTTGSGGHPGTAADLVAFAGAACDVDVVVAGGEVIVAEGRHRRLGDVADLLEEAVTPLMRAD